MQCKLFCAVVLPQQTPKYLFHLITKIYFKTLVAAFSFRNLRGGTELNTIFFFRTCCRNLPVQLMTSILIFCMYIDRLKLNRRFLLTSGGTQTTMWHTETLNRKGSYFRSPNSTVRSGHCVLDVNNEPESGLIALIKEYTLWRYKSIRTCSLVSYSAKLNNHWHPTEALDQISSKYFRRKISKFLSKAVLYQEDSFRLRP